MKHGKGRIVVASIDIFIIGTLSSDADQKEEYTGEFYMDQMCGEGEYIYKSGAVYRG